MANQPQTRPWFRLGSIARPMQPVAPPPGPAPRPQMQPPAAPLPRPTMTRPIFRPPIATQPQPAQEAPRPPQASGTPAPPSASVRPLAPVTPGAVARPGAPAPAFVTPASPTKPHPPVATTSAATAPISQRPSTPASPIKAPITQGSPLSSPDTRGYPLPASPVGKNSPVSSPVMQRSPAASSVTQRSPAASLVTQRSPAAFPVTQRSPAASPITQRSPAASPVTQRSHPLSPAMQNSPPASSLTQKSPTSPRASLVSASFSLPSSEPYTKTNSPSPSPRVLSSPAKPSSPSPPLEPSMSPLPSPHFFPFKQSALSAEQNNAARSATVGSRLPYTTASPRAAMPLPETPPESPKTQHAHPSPPSFSLPPSQFKSEGEHQRTIPSIAEQKTMLHVQETVGKPKSFLQSYGDNAGKPQHIKPIERELHKKAYDSDDVGMRFITISGENRGAVMELGFPPRTLGNRHGYSVSSHSKPSRDTEGNLSGSEGTSKMQGRNPNAKTKSSSPMHAFTNSNLQGINSSIVFNSTLSHHDPGVHFSLARKPLKAHMKEHGNDKSISQRE